MLSSIVRQLRPLLASPHKPNRLQALALGSFHLIDHMRRSLIALLCILNSIPLSAGELEELHAVMAERAIKSHVSEEILTKYVTGSKLDAALQDGFTKKLYPVRLSAFEEWPASQAGAEHYLSDPVYETLLDSLKKVRNVPPEEFTVIQQIATQSDLWAAFDELYADGILPGKAKSYDEVRWKRLLWELAQTISHLRPRQKEIDSLGGSNDIAVSVLGKEAFEGSAEFWSLEQNFLHDIANGFRRWTRIRFYDPLIDFNDLSDDQLKAFAGRQIRLNEGGRALLAEFALAINTNNRIVTTPVPLIVKSYQITDATPKSRELHFEIYRLRRNAKRLTIAALERFPDDAEGWARIDFPNIPNKTRPAYRAPLRSQVCRSCHHGFPNAFAPAYTRQNPASLQLSSDDLIYPGKRSLSHKLVSAEVRGLLAYFNMKAPAK